VARSPRVVVSPPSSEIQQQRKAAGLTQTKAAQLIYTSLRSWQEWEAGGCDMHPAFWELFLHKTRRLRSRRATASPDPTGLSAEAPGERTKGRRLTP